MKGSMSSSNNITIYGIPDKNFDPLLSSRASDTSTIQSDISMANAENYERLDYLDQA